MRRDRSLIGVISAFWAIAISAPGQSSGYRIGEPQLAPQPFQQADSQHSLIGATYSPYRPEALAMPDSAENFIAVSTYGADGQSKPKPEVQKVKRPPIDPSMVGYIDNAVIHTEVRVRFDAAYHNDTPDRAELFYAKCGCYRFLPAGDPATSAYDPSAPGPGSSVPKYVNFQQLYLYGEYAPSHKLSLFGQLPFRWLQPQATSGAVQAFPNEGGISDIEVGAKFAPIASPTQFLTFQLRSSVPSGDSRQGLGTNHATIEPMMLYYRNLSERISLEAQFGDVHPLSTSKGVPTSSGHGFAGDVITYGAGTSYRILDEEQFWMSGVLELVGWNVQGGMATGRTSTDGVNIVNLKVGPRFSFGSHHSFYVGYGIALTSQTWYREIFRTEYRYAF